MSKKKTSRKLTSKRGRKMADGIYRLPNKKWRVRIKHPQDKQITLEAHLTLGEVMLAKEQLINSIATEESEPEIPTFLIYAASWLQRRSADLSVATARNYATHLELHIRPHLGHLPLDEITPAHLVRLRNKLSAARISTYVEFEKNGKTVRRKHPRWGKPYSQRAVEGIWTSMLTVLRDGLAEYGLHDISARIKGPRRSRAEASARRGRALSPEELSHALSYLRDHCSLWLLYVLLATTGMRQGEGRLLTWNRVRLEEGYVWLDKDDTKNALARWVPLHPKVTAWLKSHRQHQLSAGLEGELVFPSKHGTARRAGTVADVLTYHCKRAGLGHVTPHDLRRSFVTHAVDSGTPGPTIRAVVGHKSSAMTDLYYRAQPEQGAKLIGEVGAPILDGLLAPSDE